MVASVVVASFDILVGTVAGLAAGYLANLLFNSIVGMKGLDTEYGKLGINASKSHLQGAEAAAFPLLGIVLLQLMNALVLYLFARVIGPRFSALSSSMFVMSMFIMELGTMQSLVGNIFADLAAYKPPSSSSGGTATPPSPPGNTQSPY